MINILAIFFFITQFFNSCQKDSQYSYLTFNDKFSYIKYNNNSNPYDCSIQFYLGNELVLLYVQTNKSSPNNIIMENNTIIVHYKGYTLLNYNINDTKVYYIQNRCLIFSNKTSKIIFNFSDYLIINNTLHFTEINNFNISSARAEYIFIENYLFAYLIFIFGCLITSYGAYHYYFGFFAHFFYVIFFFIGDITIFSIGYERYILYVFFVILLSSVLLSLFFYYKNEKKNAEKQDEKKAEKQDENTDDFPKKKFKFFWEDESEKIITVILNSIYGIAFGAILFKTIIYHFMNFGIYLNTNECEYNRAIYLSVLFFFSGLTCAIYVFDLFQNYRYLICSAVAGSYYIIKSIEYIIGGYISNYLLYLAQEKYEYNNDYEIALTYFLIHIFIIIYSVIFQLFYLKHKESSMPSIEETGRASNFGSSSRTSRVTNDNEQNDQPNIKDEDESLLGNKNQDENSINEEGDINDQDD
jgi:hypothetical protein